MRTTVALESGTRDRLMELKRKWRTKSVDDVIERLLSGTPRSARSIYEERKAKVDAVVREYGIRRLTAFGSRARGEGRPDSDLDLAGRVPKDVDLFGLVHLRDDLADAFGMPIDFVDLDAAKPRTRERIERDGVVLVE